MPGATKLPLPPGTRDPTRTPISPAHSSQMGTAGLNLANFEDPVADELIAKGRTPMTPKSEDSYRQFRRFCRTSSRGDHCLPALAPTHIPRDRERHHWVLSQAPAVLRISRMATC